MFADLPDLIAKRAELTPDKVALEEIATGRCLTYAKLDRRAGQAASLMASRGVAEGDSVAIGCRNRIAFFELMIGCAKLGAILVPRNGRMQPSEINQWVEEGATRRGVGGGEEEGGARERRREEKTSAR